MPQGRGLGKASCLACGMISRASRRSAPSGTRPAVKSVRARKIIRVGVTLLDLTPAGERQLGLFLGDDGERGDLVAAAVVLK